MGEHYRFFDSIDGEDEREYTADEFAEYFRQFIRNGIFSGGENLKVETDEQDMKIYIKPGYAWIEGYLYKIDTEPLVMEHKIADPSLNRIDRVVIRLDKTLENRYVKAFVLEGIPAENPQPLELTRGNNIYEISLAQVEIIAGKSFIESYQITDERLNNDVCGITTHLFEQVDTTDVFNEWMDYLNHRQKEADLSWDEWLGLNTTNFTSLFYNWLSVSTLDWEEDFEIWFEGIKGQLEEDVATNILREINDLRETQILPIEASTYNEISQWADIFIPDADRGRALLQLLLTYGESSEQVASSRQAMLVIMEEGRLDKERQVPADYEQTIHKLGFKTEVGQCLAWVEDLLADHVRGIEKLELGLTDELGSKEVAKNKYAMRVIMLGEMIDGLTDYRVKEVV